MRRRHVPELEDEAWFPAFLRDALTAFLEVAEVKLRLFAPAAPLVAELCRRHGAVRIVDLCSGGGGPVLALLDELRRVHDVTVPCVLTDKFPNLAAFARAETSRPGRVAVRRESVDATAVPEDLRGLRTLFNAFHHFRPALARGILDDAARKGQPLAIFEVVERSPGAVAMVAGLPLGVAALTPFEGTVSWARLAATYAVPVVPACVMWDGLASCLRAYSVAELRELTASVDVPGYGWEVGQARLPWSPLRMTYVLGQPTA